MIDNTAPSGTDETVSPLVSKKAEGDKMELDALVETVRDEETFLTFLKALAADRAEEAMKEAKSPSSPYGPGANGWEHSTIEAFLDAAAACAIDGRHVHADKRAVQPWKRCAQILLAGKSYE